VSFVGFTAAKVFRVHEITMLNIYCIKKCAVTIVDLNVNYILI
jgi:hypothetical protein